MHSQVAKTASVGIWKGPLYPDCIHTTPLHNLQNALYEWSPSKHQIVRTNCGIGGGWEGLVDRLLFVVFLFGMFVKILNLIIKKRETKYSGLRPSYSYSDFGK